jgi:uncharacterized protein
MKTLNIVTLALLIIGGLNWGLVGLFDFDLVAALFGVDSVLSNLVYILVGLSALYQLVPFFQSFASPYENPQQPRNRSTHYHA